MVTKGSGNVFRDLGFSEQKSAELILKSSLLQALQETIRQNGWKQVQAADALGIDQAKVSKLLPGGKWRDSPSNASCISFPC
jgi:predicted XRE-type DNA-binding protein